MKIIQIMPEFHLAGAETMVENLSNRLHDSGHDVLVLSMYDLESEITVRLKECGIRFETMGKKPGLDFSMIGKFRKVIEREQPDVIHTHRYVDRYVVPAALKAHYKGKMVHTVHNVAEKEVSRSGQFLNNLFYHHCGLIPVALTPEIQKSIMERYDLPEDKVPVVINGIDTSKFQAKEDHSRCDKEYFTVLHIGRFSAQKNHEGLIRAFEVFHRTHKDSRLILVGEGELYPRIKELIDTHGLESCVTLAGTTGDVNEFFQKADVFILPSNYEGLPMTLLEAMCAGLPVIASDVGGVPFLVHDGINGLLVQPETDSITAALENMYQNEDLRAELGNKARETVLKSFSSEAMADGYLALYK